MLRHELTNLVNISRRTMSMNCGGSCESSVSAEGLHNFYPGIWKRGCAILVACVLLSLIVGCVLAGVGVYSGTLRPPTTHRRAGPVQLDAFVLCRSRNTFNPCVSGRRTYEVWLMVDWKRIGAGAARSYRLVNMALD
jgi:hypothetical protein